MLQWDDFDENITGPGTVIIRTEHIEELINNLKWLSEEKMKDRCIGFYATVCTVDNAAWRNSDCSGEYTCDTAGNSNSTYADNICNHASGEGLICGANNGSVCHGNTGTQDVTP